MTGRERLPDRREAETLDFEDLAPGPRASAVGGKAMTAKIHKLQIPARLRCSSCGADSEAACDCGVTYVPAGEYAAKAAMARLTEAKGA